VDSATLLGAHIGVWVHFPSLGLAGESQISPLRLAPLVCHFPPWLGGLAPRGIERAILG
jgi:hypothetical protein